MATSTVFFVNQPVWGKSERKEPHKRKCIHKEKPKRYLDTFKSRTLVGLISLQQPSSSMEEPGAVILGTPQSFAILWLRCWQLLPEGRFWACHAAHVAVPPAAPSALQRDSKTEMLFLLLLLPVDVRTSIVSFNQWSCEAAVLLRDITPNRYITYENVQAWPQLLSNRCKWIDNCLSRSLEHICHSELPQSVFVRQRAWNKKCSSWEKERFKRQCWLSLFYSKKMINSDIWH